MATQKKVNLKKVGVLSVANVAALIYLVLAVVYYLAGLATGDIVYGSFLLGLSGFFMILISFAIGAWIGGLLFGVLYNLFSKRLGGVELYLA